MRLLARRFPDLVRFFENKVMTGFVKVYVDVFRALPTIVLVSLIHYARRSSASTCR